MHRRQFLVAGTASALAAPAVRAQSQLGAVTLFTPFAAGGQIDAAARKYASRMAALLQRPVLVENKPGAGGVLAAQHVLRSRMDGRTLLVTSSSFLIAPHINRNAGYDAFRDFTEVSGLYASSAVLVAGSGSKAADAAQFVAQAKREPGKYSYSTNGAGTYSHLLMEKFMSDAGIQLVHVPYKSAPEASQAVFQNLVEAAIDTPFSAASRARAGQLRPMLVFGAEREASMRDVPTAAEAGYPEAGKLIILAGIAAPAKTPADALGPLVEASRAAVADATYGSELRDLGMQPVTQPVAALRKTMQEQDRFFAGVIDKLKIQVGG